MGFGLTPINCFSSSGIRAGKGFPARREKSARRSRRRYNSSEDQRVYGLTIV